MNVKAQKTHPILHGIGAFFAIVFFGSCGSSQFGLFRYGRFTKLRFGISVKGYCEMIVE